MGKGKGKIIIHPEGTPLPSGHPFATPRIFSGVKQQDFYGANSTERKNPPPTPASSGANAETKTVGMDDPAWMAGMQERIDASLQNAWAKKQVTGKPPKA